MIMRIDVVLPAPLGPMNPYRAPRGIVRSRPSTATCAPNVFLTPRSSIAASVCIPNVPPRSGRPDRDQSLLDVNYFRYEEPRSLLRRKRGDDLDHALALGGVGQAAARGGHVID